MTKKTDLRLRDTSVTSLSSTIRSSVHLAGRAGLLLLAAVASASAQTFTLLHTNSPGAFQSFVWTNSDGANPSDRLLLSGTTLYGTAAYGGAGGNGTVFSVNTDGSGFNLLYTFSADSVAHKTDGSTPNGGLVLSGTTLYGTTTYGGGNNQTFVDQGVVFSLTTSKTYSTLYYFSALDVNTATNTDGAEPLAGLILVGTRLYGTAAYGGTGGNGTVFSLPTSGGQGSLTVLHHFSTGTTADGFIFTNNDGAIPCAPLLLSGGTLFGTTYTGGTNGQGVVFKVNTNGTGFQVLCHLNDPAGFPTTGLVRSGSTLYGMGGSVAFSLSTNSTGFAVLNRFTGNVAVSGGNPGLTLLGGTLFGAAAGAGAFNNGQVFAVSTNGSGFADFHDFSNLSGSYPMTNTDGAFANGGLVLTNGALYGTASDGGKWGNGVLFKITPPFELLAPAKPGTNFLFSLLSVAGQSYTLQQNTNLTGTNWVARTNITGDGSVVQFVVPATNRLFFRLRQP